MMITLMYSMVILSGGFWHLFPLDLWLHLSKEPNSQKSMGVWVQHSMEDFLGSL